MLRSSRPVRLSRWQGRTPKDILPFPDGQPDPSNHIEVLLFQLNSGAFSAEQLARVDDFLVRALFERKYKSTKQRESEAQKFIPGGALANGTALEVAKRWNETPNHLVTEWRKKVAEIWDEVVAPKLHSQAGLLDMKHEDEECFKK